MSSDPRRATRVLVAFVLANARYWTCVAAQGRRELRHWEARAQAIEDPELRALALQKLHAEGFNAEAAAMAATIAPRATREHAVRAIVTLELLFDCLDGLSERPHADPLGEGERLYTAFVGALGPHVVPSGEQAAALDPPAGCSAQALGDVGADAYLQELGRAVRSALSQLPASEAVAPFALRCATRGAQAQIRMHASSVLGTAQLGDWARGEARGSGLQWREFAAGAACSVLALHALIAAAADPHTTSTHAQAIEQAYLFTGATVTLLDGVVDHEHDAAMGELSYAGLYEDPALLAQALAQTAREASRHSAELRNGAHHLMTLAGAVAYWCSAPGARDASAQPALAMLRRELRGLLFVPLLTMRIWRASRRASLAMRSRAQALVGPRTQALAGEIQEARL
jgi:tetraprenyl-beta-curcumene synthase